jgi:hypothetical protein
MPPQDPNAMRLKGWFRDPYDPLYDSIASYTVSDEPQYDEHFPQHPLSRIRRKFPEILDDLELSNEFAQ